MVLNTTLFKNTYEEEDGILTNTLSGRYENNRVVTLGSFALYDQQHITELILPHATTINQYACANLSNCSHIELNWSEITTINQYAFRSCSLWTDSISCGATTIGSYAFLGCRNLTNIALSKVNTLQLRAFEGCNTLSFIYLPLINNIYQSVFWSCYSLQTVIMSGTAAGTISANAFQNCYHLLSLYLLGSLVKPLANVNAFSNTPISTYTTSTGGIHGSIYVPSSLYATYIASTNWITYSARFVSMTDQEIEDFLSSL